MKKDFEFISHTADLTIRAYGTTPQELFSNVLKGMFQSAQPQIAECSVQDDRIVCDSLPEHHEIKVTSGDVNSLLVDFLSQALSLSATNNEVYLDVTFKKFDTTHLVAVLHGIKIKGFEESEIKAVTYHEVHVKQVHGLWQVDIVFDKGD